MTFKVVKTDAIAWGEDVDGREQIQQVIMEDSSFTDLEEEEGQVSP